MDFEQISVEFFNSPPFRFLLELPDRKIDWEFAPYVAIYGTLGETDEEIEISLTLHALFGNARIRELIQCQPTIHLQANGERGWFGDRLPKGVNELCFRATEEIADLERLKSLVELFSETLNHLCHIGSASEDDPSLGKNGESIGSGEEECLRQNLSLCMFHFC